MIEVYKDIPGYESLYQVSNLGNVKSLKFGKEVILSPGMRNDGYLLVNLWKNGEKKGFLVHRLVAQAFIPNPFNYPVINHKDHNRQNNNVENLEWCTAQYNVEYSRAKPVGQYSLDDGKLIFTWKSLAELYRYSKYNPSCISKCCRGLLPSAYGYKWRYYI